ncbi:MAG TPA: DUF456 domain-containing protein, partial [Thermodesulfobacteriota bacterium]|nr:DUF456 domain-containing protein [Thermodesulfobacteriota bacterium]
MFFHVIVVLVTVLLMAAGLVGCVVPFLPGSPLIVLGAFLYAWHTEFQTVTWVTLLVLVVLAVASHLLEFFASALGVKRFGGSGWGMTGAAIGAFLGLFGGIPGLILGPFLGAFLLELLHTRRLEVSLRSGWGTFIGFLFGTLGKVVIALIMIGIFV